MLGCLQMTHSFQLLSMPLGMENWLGWLLPNLFQPSSQNNPEKKSFPQPGGKNCQNVIRKPVIKSNKVN